MRISDWSSDVCSSDLARRSHRMPRMTRIDFYILPEGGGPGGSPVMTACKLCDKATAGGHRVYAHVPDPVTAGGLDGALRRFQQGGFFDRKCVVLGKSVSVRVELGCRRVLETTKTKEDNNPQATKSSNQPKL